MSELEHHGVRGQKWGVIRERGTSVGSSTVKTISKGGASTGRAVSKGASATKNALTSPTAKKVGRGTLKAAKYYVAANAILKGSIFAAGSSIMLGLIATDSGIFEDAVKGATGKAALVLDQVGATHLSTLDRLRVNADANRLSNLPDDFRQANRQVIAINKGLYGH